MIRIFTRGYLHKLPTWVPVWNVELDLRELRDPAHVLPEHMRDLRGDLNEEVRAFVLETHGAPELLGRLVSDVLGAFAVSEDGDVVVMIGCAGGKHRAASFGVFLTVLLRAIGFRVSLTHLHAALPRVIKK